jgi:hypothetical protein
MTKSVFARTGTGGGNESTIRTCQNIKNTK